MGPLLPGFGFLKPLAEARLIKEGVPFSMADGKPESTERERKSFWRWRRREAAVPQPTGLSSLADPVTSMAPRFNIPVRWFGRRFFEHFNLSAASVHKLRELEQRGAVIYVMRYSSRLDYLLFNTIFLREGLRLSSFANGIRFFAYRSLWQGLRIRLRRKRGRSRAVEHGEDQSFVRRLTKEGSSFFLFLRTQRLQTFWRGLFKLRHRQDEFDLLQEVVREGWSGSTEIFIVPLSLFWRKGPRSPNRFLNLDYGSLSRPSDLAKILSFLVTYRSLSVKMGDAVDLNKFVDSHRDEGQSRVARRIRRSLLIYLRREEKVVAGPTLKSAHRTLQLILGDPGVKRAMAERAEQRRHSPERSIREAEKIYREIAARMNSTLLAILAFTVGLVLKRLFSSIETEGLERVAETAKEHPIVLVPTHRSYFDFLIISYLFYDRYLVPPHIAARENMAFGPFGLIFRMAGAFYLRRSFSDPLYKEVFRAYVAYLVREGFTQEFFIEGGRSRTGQTLKPRLGMLTWDVDAFLESPRKDLFFVPIAITYERLVEERGIVSELEGEKRSQESTIGLIRARKYLKHRFGSVHVNFGQPLSLAEALGDRRGVFERHVRSSLRPGDDAFRPIGGDGSFEKVAEDKRIFVRDLANRLVEKINWSVTVNATSVAATALLGTEKMGLRRSDLVRRMQQFCALFQQQGTRMTPAVIADLDGFEDSISFLLRGDAVRSADDSRGEIIYCDERQRRALCLYRNAIVHYLATPSILARSLLASGERSTLVRDLQFWNSLLYREFFVARPKSVEDICDLYLTYFQSAGWLSDTNAGFEPTEEGRDFLGCLAAQTGGVIECYGAVIRALEEAGGRLGRDQLFEASRMIHLNNLRMGVASYPEAANDATLGNALDLLIERQILETVDPGPDRARPDLLAPGERWSQLADLGDLLAKASADG